MPDFRVIRVVRYERVVRAKTEEEALSRAQLGYGADRPSLEWWEIVKQKRGQGKCTQGR